MLKVVNIPCVIYLSRGIALRQFVLSILYHLPNSFAEVSFNFCVIKTSRKVALAFIFPCIIRAITLFCWIVYGHTREVKGL